MISVRFRAARAARAAQVPRAPATKGKGDKGVASLEFTGFLPILLIVVLAAIQLGIAGYAALQAGSGARAGARIGSQEDYRGQCTAAGNAAMSGWLVARGGNVTCGGGDIVQATATVPVPSIIPGFTFGPITRTVSMPADDTTP
ncbi:septum formation initiator [Streptomyces spiroverticillatus]|uniref:Septum formation initiator n=1 Tax=Streptomyces finlayi TaxID=67296 RepID=A0A919C6H8_9ACTN|nr:TadE/TadG family type IV pilus assembly protein [Streptomyces finlayi]GGZ86703.1 septum formation initiator [Streptomyces spiroverticillatus]GHC78193.1 septum formation initiator [Streptomyces finlayi]